MEQTKYDFIGYFRKGFAIVAIKDKWNLINEQGSLLSDQWFDWSSDFNNGFAIVMINGIHKTINKKGEIVNGTN